MLVVKPMPEEFAAGHAWCYMALNAYKSTWKKPATAVSSFLSLGVGVREPSPIHALAKACGLPVEDYARRHTLMLFHAFASQLPNAERPECWTVAQYKRLGVSTPGQVARMCPECIAQDLATLGFSYWRRGHQCPGLVWCVEHRKPLREINRPDAFLRAPADWIAIATTVVGYTAKCPRRALKRYHQTAEWMWTHGLPAPLKELGLAMAAQARSKGIVNASYSNEQQLLSDHVWSTFPSDWLHHTLPRTKNKVPGQRTTCLDAVLRVRQSEASGARGPQVAAAAVAVAISVLFQSTEELVQALKPTVRRSGKKTTTSAESSCRPRFERRPEYAPAGAAMLARAYLDHAGDHAAIARCLGLGEDEVRSKLAVKRQPLLAQLHLTPEYAALLAFLAGETQESVRLKYAITQPVLDAMLRLLHRKIHLPSSEVPPTRSELLRQSRADRRYQQLKAELKKPKMAAA